MNYIEYLKPGNTIKVKKLDGTDYGSEIQSTNLRNLYEYVKNTAEKIKRYNEVNAKLKEINPKGLEVTSNNYKWNLLDFLRNPDDPRYQSLSSQFGSFDTNSSSDVI